MRVLQLIETLARGGAEHALIDLVAGLRDRGLSVDVAALGPPTVLSPAFEAMGAKVHVLGDGRRWDPRVAGRLTTLQRGYDVVHAHLFMSELYATTAAAGGSRCARVVTLHNLGYDASPPTTVAQRLRRQFHKRVVTRAVDAFIAVSDAAAASYRAHLGIDSVDVIPNAFALPADAPSDSFDAAEFRRARGLGGGRLVVSAGRLSPEKGHRDLVEAVGGLGLPDVHVVMVGDGPLRDELAAAARSVPNVRLLGALPRDETLRWIAAADVFALPSLHEAFGIVLLEAMGLGRAIVATETGGVTTLISHDRTGRLVPPGAPRALATELARLLDDDALRSRLGAAARAEAATRFGRAHVAEKVEAVYRRVIIDRR